MHYDVSVIHEVLCTRRLDEISLLSTVHRHDSLRKIATLDNGRNTVYEANMLGLSQISGAVGGLLSMTVFTKSFETRLVYLKTASSFQKKPSEILIYRTPPI